MQPTKGLFQIVTTMFKDAWTQRTAQTTEQRAQLKLDVTKTQKQIDQFLDRIVETDSPTVIEAYEKTAF